MIDLTKHFVPEVYSNSRDFRVFLRIIEVLVNSLKYNIDHFLDLYSPEDCPDNLLPLLAGMVGYEYDNTLSIDNNRVIIKYFPYLIRNRGSERGIKLAAALSLNMYNSLDDNSVVAEEIDVAFDYEKGIIYVYYPKGYEVRKYLIEVVRPVGMTVELIPVDKVVAHEDLKVRSDVNIYNRFDNYSLQQSQVSFSPLTKNPEESEAGTTNG